MATIVALPRFGTGLKPVFEGSPLRVTPIAGRLKMAGRNIRASHRTIRTKVASYNAKAIRDAKENTSFINVKA